MAGTTVGKLNAILTADTSAFTQQLTSASNSIKSLAAGFGIGFGASEIVGFLASAVHEADEAAKSQAKLEAALAATGNVAGLTAKQIGDLATALQDKVAIDDDVIKSSAAVLISFGNIRGEILQKSIPAVADLARFMGKDMESAALMLGKALSDPEEGMGALGKAGIKLSAEQKKLVRAFLEVNNIAAAQGVILDEAASHVEGAAERMATPVDRLKVRWANFKEGIGAGVEALLAATDDMERLRKATNDLAGESKELIHVLQDESAFFTQLSESQQEYVDKLESGLQKQIATFGMSTDEIKLWEAAQKHIPQDALDAARALMEEANALEESAKAMKEQEQAAAASQRTMESIKDSIWEQHETMWMSTKQIQLWKLAMEGADEAELKFYADLLDGIEAHKEFAEAEKKREADAESIHKSTRTQAERAQEELDRVTELFWQGLVPLEDYQRKLQQIADSFGEAADAKDDLFAAPAALEFGTAAAYSGTRPGPMPLGDTKTHDKLDEVKKVLETIDTALRDLVPVDVGRI